MDQTHLHLLITHLPIFGSILGGIVLAYGLWAKVRQTLIAAYTVLIISSTGAIIGYITGEAAEETVEHLQGISENVIKQHENFAQIALISMLLVGILSLIGLFLAYRKSLYSNTIGWITLVVSLISFGIIARTGYLGGQIRHTELSSVTSGQAIREDDGDDD
ncbi:MAG: hypothetical protein H7Y13_04435 [Sphingobacteriaceae bacterium]|nr:hypothetical protein [Sphingobacteriaceae bacterium]